ncbi:hypothetical protein [Paenibacillus brevis]|uniref:Integrase n=1 Tax=Paenibacillus brevis TaxID=2841508 RepID=A0ABS6FRC1_9BACL|nr:hypothetical protein [Paenibacillus brevis]MBU5672674.1 hypothetical protein [Paenibacillus brevis]
MKPETKIRTLMAFFLYLQGKSEEAGRTKISDWAKRQYRKYRTLLSMMRKPLVDRRDDVDRLGLTFRSLQVRQQLGITFEEYVRRVRAGAWLA